MILDKNKINNSLKRWMPQVDRNRVETLLEVCEPLPIITPLMLSWRIMNVFQSEDEEGSYKAAKEVLNLNKGED